MYRRGRSPPRGYSPPMGRRWSPPQPEVHRRHSSPPRFMGPPPGDLRGSRPPLYDRRSPPRAAPPAEMRPRSSEQVIPSVRVTFKNPLQRPEDDPNNIPIQPRHPPARTSVVVVPVGGRVPPGTRQRSRSPVRRRPVSPPRHRSPPQRRDMAPPPYAERLPPPVRGRSPPPPMRSSDRGMRDLLPPPGYDRRREPSPPPYMRGPPGMMGPPGMRGPPGRPLSPPRISRPRSPPRMAARPLSPPRMAARPLSPPRRHHASPPGGPRMMPVDRGYPLADRGGGHRPGQAGSMGPGPRGSYPEPMDIGMPNGRGAPPPAMRADRYGPPPMAENSRGGYAAGPGPASAAYRGGSGVSPRGDRGRPAAAHQPAAAAAAITNPQQMRGLRTVTLDRNELARLGRDPAVSSFYYEDPQGEIQGPHSVVQFQQWMRFLSKSEDEQHRLAYEQFRNVAVWRKGMSVRVPLTALLAVVPE